MFENRGRGGRQRRASASLGICPCNRCGKRLHSLASARAGESPKGMMEIYVKHVSKSKKRWLRQVQHVTERPNHIRAGGTATDEEEAAKREPVPLYGRTVMDIDPVNFLIVMEETSRD